MTLLQSAQASLLLSILISNPLFAQQPSPATVDRDDPEVVFAYQGDAVVTQQAMDAAFSRIPEENRLMFIRDGAKVDRMVQSLLQTKAVAADAQKAGYSDEVLVAERMRLAAEKELAEAWMVEINRRAPQADYAAMAEEDYLVNPSHYMPPVDLDVSHILIGTDNRTDEEAKTLANELHGRLIADPSLFNEYVAEYSDDPAKLTNFGHYTDLKPGQMVAPFEKAAYALKENGQISKPVKTDYGFHLIRLDRRVEPVLPPFEKVKKMAEEQMKVKHLEDYRINYLQKLMQNPIVLPEGSVEIMARRYFGEDLELAPIFGADGPEDDRQ